LSNPARKSELKCFLAGLTLILLRWRMWWAINKASKWHIWFNSAFKF